MKIKLTIFCIVVMAYQIFFCSTTFGNSMKEAEALYNKGDYKTACNEFLKISEEKGTSPELLYNIGNSYYKQGDIGHSRLFLERARKLDPQNKLINNNLEFIANSVNDANEADRHGKKVKVTPDEISFFAGIDRAISYNRTSNFWSIYAALSFLLFIASISLYLFSRNVNTRKAGFFGSLIFLFFSVAFVVFSLMAAKSFELHDECIQVEYKCELHSEPSSDSKLVSSPLNQGTKFKIVDEEAGPEGKIEWYKVRLNSEIQGWIPANAIETI